MLNFKLFLCSLEPAMNSLGTDAQLYLKLGPVQSFSDSLEKILTS